VRVAGVVLAAGAGTRLRPLTSVRPKALCPVGGRALVDLALDRLAPAVGLDPMVGLGPALGLGPAVGLDPTVGLDPALGAGQLAVNAHHHADAMRAHFAPSGRVHLQIEDGEALGTAGALGALRPWLDGRPALVTNADSYLPGGLAGFLDGWDGERCRLLCTVVPAGSRPDFVTADGAGLRYVGACLLPWHRIRELAPVPSGLYELLWRGDDAAGALDLVRLPPGSVAIDCGTPADYLAANLHASGGASVVGAGATVLGRLARSVVWDGAWVGPDEVLVEQIRAGDCEHPLTVDGSGRP
jgi:MurNAc alpha-1-phosphate uridylyltransferase